MPDNKTKPTEVTVASFIDTLPDENRRADAHALIALMQGVTGEEPKMWGPSIVDFGSIRSVYESGRIVDMPLAGFSPRKAATVLYGLTLANSEALIAKLGKHTTGKGCLYIKKLTDVDQEVLKAMVLKAVRAKRAH